MQTDDEATKQRADERRQAEADLQQIEPKLQEARERLDRASVRAPVSGLVVGLSVNTVGAVVAPGERLMEIVPDRTATVIEAKIAPSDASGLKVGQAAKVRLSAGPDGRPLVLQAVISRLSPDVMIDPHSGQSFFVADATLPASSPANASRDQLRPGAPAQVIVSLRKRTALQYWLEPLTQSFWRSFHER
jgi:HlyD family secretion protein